MGYGKCSVTAHSFDLNGHKFAVLANLNSCICCEAGRCKKSNRLLLKLKRMRQDQIKNERKTGVYMLINEDFE